MAIIPILQYPDPRLGKKAKRVERIDENVQKVIDDMLETLNNTDNCAGLAATQLDFKDPLCITVMFDYRNEPDLQNLTALCLINPDIIEKEGVTYEEEGCMSVSGGVYEPVNRAAKVKVRAMDREGQIFELEGEGYMAKLIQHEVDHLNGIIFIDRLSRLKRQRIDRKFAKQKRWSK